MVPPPPDKWLEVGVRGGVAPIGHTGHISRLRCSGVARAQTPLGRRAAGSVCHHTVMKAAAPVDFLDDIFGPSPTITPAAAPQFPAAPAPGQGRGRTLPPGALFLFIYCYVLFIFFIYFHIYFCFEERSHVLQLSVSRCKFFRGGEDDFFYVIHLMSFLNKKNTRQTPWLAFSQPESNFLNAWPTYDNIQATSLGPSLHLPRTNGN